MKNKWILPAFFTGAGLLCAAFIETYLLATDVILIKDESLKTVFNGSAAVHISDLHMGSFGFLHRQILSELEKIRPSVIFLTGDLIENNAGIKECVRFAGELTKISKVIAVPGNSDYPSHGRPRDTAALISGLEKAGVVFLVNSAVALKFSGGQTGAGHLLTVIGLDDNYLMRDDFFAASRNTPADTPKILLAHAPNIVEKLNTRGINLILSGHTHGGQVSLPLLGALYLNMPCNSRKKFVQGIYEDGVKIFVSRGVGTTVIPLRFFSRPQLAVLEFV